MTVVATNAVIISKGYEPTPREIKKVMPYLTTQGLIEPLKLDENNEVGKRDINDPARLEACKQLNWPTVIVAFDPIEE